jgi:hypothetical protein
MKIGKIMMFVGMFLLLASFAQVKLALAVCADTDGYVDAVIGCVADNTSTCCPDGEDTNPRRSFACFISSCGPSCNGVPQDSPGDVTQIVEILKGLGFNSPEPGNLCAL